MTEIEKNLSELLSQPTVEGVILGTRDGLLKGVLPAPTNIRDIQDTGSLVAMASVMLGAAETSFPTSLLGKDILREIILRGEHTSRVIIGAGSKLFMVAIVNISEPNENVLQEIRKTAEEIRKTESKKSVSVIMGFDSWD